MREHLISNLDVVESTGYCSTCGRRMRVVFEPGKNGTSTARCINWQRVGGPPPIDDVPPTPGQESDVQQAVTDALTLAGCDFWQTSAWRQKTSSGVTKGIPDLLVRLPSMAAGIAIGIEVKAAKGRASSDQANAINRGLIAAVVRSPIEALQAVESHCGIVSENECLRLRRTIDGLRRSAGLPSSGEGKVIPMEPKVANGG